MRNAGWQGTVDAAAIIAARRQVLPPRCGECARFPPLFGKSLPAPGAYDAWHG
jgi:hypothetical protein